MEKVNLQTIANLVGVSKMTVLRYLKDENKVSSEMGAKIKQTILEKNYIFAKQLSVKNNITTIGVIVPNFSNQVFNDVLFGIEKAAAKYNYELLVVNSYYNSKKEEKHIFNLIQHKVDALILTETEHSVLAHQAISQHQIPVVEIMNSKSLYFSSVGYDSYTAAYQITKKMIEKGRKNIVFLRTIADLRSISRETGYKQAMDEYKLEAKIILANEKSSYSLGSYLLNKTRMECAEVDGIFATNDVLAIGVLIEASKQGIKVPFDLSIAGFHSSNLGQTFSPSLSSILTPKVQMGEIAIDLIRQKFNGNTEKQNIILPFSIFEGGSL